MVRRLEGSSWKNLGGGYQMDVQDSAWFGWAHLDGRLLPDSLGDNRLWRPLTGGLNLWDTTSTPRSR